MSNVTEGDLKFGAQLLDGVVRQKRIKLIIFLYLLTEMKVAFIDFDTQSFDLA